MKYNEWWHGFGLAEIAKANAIRVEDRDRDGAHTVAQFNRTENGWEYQGFETPYGGSGWTGEVLRSGAGMSDESVLNRLNGYASAYHFMHR